MACPYCLKQFELFQTFLFQGSLHNMSLKEYGAEFITSLVHLHIFELIKI